MNHILNLKSLRLLTLVLACFALLPGAQAVSPAPDGDYPGGNTAEGFNALFHLSPQDGGFNTALGFYSLFSNTTGSFNTALGAGALDLNTGHNNTATGAAALLLNTTGTGNTATGAFALVSNSTADGNTAVGAAALASNVTGPGNTAVGARALLNNTGDNSNPPNGRLNTTVGLNALTANTTGNGNTAVGAGPGGSNVFPGALGSNTTGSNNTAVGGTDEGAPAALGSNTTGSSNTAVGTGALGLNTTGFLNTAIGGNALTVNTTGGSNTAVSNSALSANTTGESNTAVGNDALSSNSTGSNNTAVGNGALGNLRQPSPTPPPPNTGENNVALGFNAGSGVMTASNVTCIGANVAGADVSNSCFIGNIWAEAGGSQAVYVNSLGKLGAQVSSRRFKDQIKPIDKASEALFSLKPVSFHYKKEIDPAGTPQLGLVAEDVEKVNPDLVIRDKGGKPYSVRYDQVNAMLLNEFLKEHRTVQEQGATITRLQKQIEALTTGLQKVSAQIEVSKSAPQTVLNR